MNRRFFILFIMSATFFAAFTGLIFAVKYIDVLPIGPDGSTVGLATINGAVFEFIGANKTFYYITDWLGIIAFAEAAAFAIYGLYAVNLYRKSGGRVSGKQ